MRERSGYLRLRPLRLPSSRLYRLARPKMQIQGLGCGFQNEATITASIQMPLDLTFHARRELPFQVPANQMHGVPTVHSCPTSSGPAWVGPFSPQQPAIRHGAKLFKLEHPGLAFSLAFLRTAQNCPSAPTHTTGREGQTPSLNRPTIIECIMKQAFRKVFVAQLHEFHFRSRSTCPHHGVQKTSRVPTARESSLDWPSSSVLPIPKAPHSSPHLSPTDKPKVKSLHS